MSSRMPVPEELTFLQHRRTGVVHILYYPDVEERPLADLTPAEAIESLALAYRRTRCGRGFATREGVGDADEVEWFPDEALCLACYRTLGDQKSLAFEHPQSCEEADRMATGQGRNWGIV